ncbi:hypothetical protein ACFQL3_16320 [Natronoarchaeum sp. GCM10025321]|uniref:hypothetical protein n=1 Tax=Natronoarchaeum sp. GCM10025321 TaxID=3252684 RepID=UPI003614877D
MAISEEEKNADSPIRKTSTAAPAIVTVESVSSKPNSVNPSVDACKIDERGIVI